MKKTLITVCALIVASTSAVLAEEVKQTPVNPPAKCNCHRPPQKGPDFKQRQAEFEQRLKLTEEKRAEIEAVKRSRIAVQAQEEKIEQLKCEIGALKQEMHRLRMENMKSFEALLTKSQLKELKKHPHPKFGPCPDGDCPPPPPFEAK